MQKILTLTAVLLLVAACGQKQDEPETAPSEAASDMPEISVPISAAVENAAMGMAFLEENKTMPGVITTPSGLQITKLTNGDASGPNPTPGQIVCVHYRGKFINGEEFDSSYSRDLPTAFPSNGVIRGWVEALSMMRAGDKWKLAIPSDLAYGPMGTPGGPIGPNQVLVFDVELLKILDISLPEYMATYRRDMTLDCSQ